MDARGLCSLLSVSYVGSVYIFPGGRSNRRDDVDVMARRIIGITIFTFFSVMNFGYNYEDWAGRIDLDVLQKTWRAAWMLHLIYLAPLLAHGAPRIVLKNWKFKLQTLRNLVIGPLTEELVYRGAIVAIYRQQGLSDAEALKENFLYFGIAHIHHAVMIWLNEEASLKTAVLQGFVHFLMTSLFGTYACYWFLKSGSIWPSVVSHVICNYYGPPPLSGPSWYVPLLTMGLAVWVYCLRLI